MDGEVRADAAGDVDVGPEHAERAPAPRRGEHGPEGPGAGEGVEYEGPRQGGGEIVRGGGEEDETAGGADGLDGETAGEEGGVAEEEVAEMRVVRKDAPGVGYGVKGVEFDERVGLGR